MNKLALLIAALALAGCAHKGSSARYDTGAASSTSSQYYSQTTWSDLEVEGAGTSPHIDAPTAANYLQGLENAQNTPTVAQQLDPGSAVNSSGISPGRDIDASASAETGIGAAAGAEIGAGASDGDQAQSEIEAGSVEAPTSSKELPGAEARAQDVPAVLAPLKDNHPDLTDAPGYPEAYLPEEAAKATRSENGEGAEEQLRDGATPPVDRDESDFAAPLGGGVPSDGSSGHLNSGSSVDRTKPESEAVATAIGEVTATDKESVEVVTVQREAEASGAPASVQSGTQSSAQPAMDPDKNLTDNIYRQLHSNPPGQLTPDNLRNIEISVDNGVVSLKGAVDSDNEKGLIEQRVFRMEGVEGVKNELSVGNPGPDNLPRD